MMRQLLSSFLCKSIMFRIGFLAGLIGIFIGCGGGGDGVSDFSSVGDGAAGNGDIPPVVDQAPTAMISSPSGTSFNEGENIVFSGTGTDNEDGQLNEGALVWTSNIDGTIGSGPTLITSVLSPGDHDITLTATDSNGATVTTAPVLVRVYPTRFLKLGFQTSGILDAFKAFDGYYDTGASITTSENAFLQFKAHIGGADTFLFRIKMGVSLLGSKLVIEGLTPDDNWHPLSDIDLDADKTVTLKITDPQTYMDADGYINLRALLVNDQSPDTVPIYELWRVDPAYAGSQTKGVDNAGLAFDGDRSTAATITDPSISMDSGNFLHFKAYLGVGGANTFSFNIKLNEIGSGHHLQVFVENKGSGNWDLAEELSLNTTEARTVSIKDAQSYLDGDGFINLRAYWVGFKTPGTIVEVYEIWRTDPFFVAQKTSFGLIVSPDSAVDDDLDSFATIYYFWGEFGHNDFLHVKTYMGDTSPLVFSIKAATSAPPDAELIIDGEYEPDNWAVIESFSLNGLATTTAIELPNAREFVNADGYLSLRFRWESDSMSHDADIYEIWRKED